MCLFEAGVQQQHGQVPLVAAAAQQRQAFSEHGPGLGVVAPLRGDQSEASEHDTDAQVVTRGPELVQTYVEMRGGRVSIALDERGLAK